MTPPNYKMICLHVSTTVTLITVIALVLITGISSPNSSVHHAATSHGGERVMTAADRWQSAVRRAPYEMAPPAPHPPQRPPQQQLQQQQPPSAVRIGQSAVARRSWDWTEVFSFVPNGIRTCQSLFANEKYLVEPFVIVYQRFVDEVKKYGPVEGNSALRIEQYLAYIKLAESPFVSTVCETGFNAGHSTLVWLEANPRTRVYSFDIGQHDYARPMAEYLARQYPGRLNVTWGDSTSTLPAFRRLHPDIRCDLVVVDGGHTSAVCRSDFEQFYRMASADNVVVLDNYPDSRLKWMTDLGNVWERAKRRGELFEIFSCSFEPADPHGFSVGRFNVAAP